MGIYTDGHIPFQVGLGGVLSNGMDEIAHIETGHAYLFSPKDLMMCSEKHSMISEVVFFVL
jgi:hypothetical protein